MDMQEVILSTLAMQPTASLCADATDLDLLSCAGARAAGEDKTYAI